MQKISRKTLIKGLGITVAVSILSMMALFAFTASSSVLPALRRVQLPFLALGVLSILSVWTVQALRIEVLARSFGQGVGMRYAFRVYLTSSFLAHVTPFSSGGIPIEIYLLYRRGISVARSSAIILVQGSLTALVLLITSPVLIFFVGRKLNYAAGADAAFVIVLAVVAALAYVLVKPSVAKLALTKLLVTGALGRAVSHGSRRPKVESAIDKICASVQQFSDSLAHLWREQRAVLFLSALLTVVYWMCYLAVVPTVIRGLGLKVNLVTAILPQLIFNLFQAFIPTPGGSGGAELGFAGMYSGVIPRSLLATFILLWRFLTFYLSLFVGGAVALSLVREFSQDEPIGVVEE